MPLFIWYLMIFTIYSRSSQYYCCNNIHFMKKTCPNAYTSVLLCAGHNRHTKKVGTILTMSGSPTAGTIRTGGEGQRAIITALMKRCFVFSNDLSASSSTRSPTPARRQTVDWWGLLIRGISSLVCRSWGGGGRRGRRELAAVDLHNMGQPANWKRDS